jgi:hypothetical protein
MRIVEPVNENEVVALFLKTEIESVRFRDAILELLLQDGKDRAIVDDPDTSDAGQNFYRCGLLGEFRGWGRNQGMFERFPRDVCWFRAVISKVELAQVRYIDYSYWVELSGGTRLPKEAAIRIRAGVDVFGVPSSGFLPLAEAARQGSAFPDLILVAKDEHSYLVVMEGHARLTGYFLAPEYIPDELGVRVGFSAAITNWGLY